MNFFAVGSNRKDSIKGTINPSDGDKALCDPGVNECSSFLLECFNNNIPSDGFFSRLDDQKKAVNFLNGINSTQFSPGVVRRFVEAVGCTTGTEIRVSHPPDSSNKRFVEVWKIPYLSVPLSPAIQSSNTSVLVASDKFALKPLIYPEEVQSLTIPPGTGDFLSFPWFGIQMYNNGEKVILYSGIAVILLEWNGSGYDQTLLHQTGTVYRASVHDTSAIVTYNDGTNKIAFYEKTTSWTLSSTKSWSYSQSDIALDNSYILVGGANQVGVTLNKSDLSVSHNASNANYLGVVPTQASKYPADPSVVVGYTTAYITTGGYTTQKVVYTRYYAASESMSIFFDAYLPDGQVNVRFYDPPFLRHPYSNDPYAGFVMRTSQGELFPYNYLQGDYSASLNIYPPSNYSGYLFDDYLVGFSLSAPNNGFRVLWAYGNRELIDLYSYNATEHKRYEGIFYPVKYPYYLTNNQDGTLRLLQIGTTHYNEIGDGLLILKFEYTEFISSTLGFTSGYNGLETCKFLISDDNIVFWKWVSPNWVVESNPSSGNDMTTFSAGCEAGFTPLNSKVVYVKVFLSSASKDNTPSLVRSSISLTVNYLSRSGKAVLCDDSKVSINFESPTSTKITSHDPGVYALASAVTVLAPPVDTYLDV